MRYLVSNVLAVSAAIDVLGILRRALDPVEFGVNVTFVAIINGFVVKEGKNVAGHRLVRPRCAVNAARLSDSRMWLWFSEFCRLDAT